MLTALLLLTAPDVAPAKATKPKRRPPNPALAAVEDVPGLPRVLLIGDSISIGYTLPTRAKLRGVANVHRIPTNGGPTTRGLAMIDDWLGEGPWDVIHFNWGLHDLKSVDENGRNASPDVGRQQVPPDQYRQNLVQLVDRLKRTGATLIFATTTPVPDGEPQRSAGSAVPYNRIAVDVMTEAGVKINDLHAAVSDKPIPFVRPGNVHFAADESEQLADLVAASVRAALPKE